MLCEKEGGMDTSNIISMIAAVIAFGSFLLSGSSYRNSKKALRLAEAEFQDKNRSIQAYLIDCYSFIKEEEKYCTFAIQFTNIASQPQSFSNVELEIEYHDQDGVFGKVIIQPFKGVKPTGMANEYSILDIPINIAAKETSSGWVTFKLPVSPNLTINIQSYKVIGRNLAAPDSYIDAYLLRKVDYEKEG